MIKKIVIILVIVIVLAAGAVAVMYFARGGESAGGLTTTLQDFFPFGQGGTPITDQSTPTIPSNPTSQGPTIAPAIRKISNAPASGVAAFTTGSTTVIRFMEKSTGNVYEANTENTDVVRISNTTVPKVAEAMFVAKNALILRYLKDGSDIIETLYGTLATSSQSQENLAELSATYLIPNIQNLVLSPKKDKMFHVVETTGGAIGNIANIDGTKASTVFNSPITEWLPQWATPDIIAVTTKPSAAVPGYMYFIDTKNSSRKKILGDINGLTTLTNSDASRVLYTYTKSDGTISTGIFTPATGSFSASLIGPTFTDKCVWSKKTVGLVYCTVPQSIPTGSYPDTWYKGLVTFSDNLWSFDVVTGKSTLIAELGKVSKTAIDAIELSLDESERFLTLINKTDLTPWSIDLAATFTTQ